METLTLDTFKEKIFNFEKNQDWKFEGKTPTIIDFYADWCGPCHALSPILERVAETYQGKVNFFKIDTEASPELSHLFGIRSIPSLLFIPVDGEPAMNSGVIPEESFEQAISDLFGIQRPT